MKNIKTICLKDGTKLSGYEKEYILTKIEETNSFYEQELLDNWILKYCNDAKVVYDIGANIGNHTVYFATRLKAEKIFSFEPMPVNFKILKKNISDNNLDDIVTPFNVALGSEKSIAKMAMTIENNNGTFKIDSNSCDESETVEVVTIDSLNLPLPDFIKIDVEGFELNVLKGMKEVLKNSNAIIQIEIDEETCEEVYSLLLEFGYDIITYDLKSSNNFIFSKNASVANAYIKEILHQNQEKIKTENLAHSFESKFLYEQKKCNDLYKDLQSSNSKFLYEQKLVADLKEKQTILNQQKDLLEQEIENLEDKNKISQEEIKHLKTALDNAKKLSAERQRILNSYNTSILFRCLKRYWSFSKKAHKKARNGLFKIGNWTYYKLSKYPKIRGLCSKINRKLKIFKNPNEVVSSQGNYENSIYKENNKVKFAKDLNVAMLVDQFTYNSFKYECNPFVIEPSNWLKIFEENKIDLFFCESAWSGVDSVKRPWKGQVYCSVNFQKENRTTLLQILKYCKENNIPTVFWNKEDPTHYPDKVHNFVDTAIKFDHIFTTSIECIDKYKQEYGHKSVHLLMFATQPKLFNPINKFERTNDIIFAGSWYKQHEVRCEEMEMILDKILESGNNLKIYNRYSESDDPNHFFPEKYTPYLNPCLSHDKLDIAYKGSKMALNINTVIDSKSMFARRVFELMSSNTLVVSNYSLGMDLLFGENVFFIEKDKPLEIKDIEKKCDTALYDVLKNHTYEVRFKQILDAIHLDYVENDKSISFIYNITDESCAEKCYSHFMSIPYSLKKGIFIVENDSLRNILYKYQGNKINVISKHYIETYEDVLSIETPYFIWTDESSNLEFIQKAILHFSYLENDVAVFNKTNSFVHEQVSFEKNMLCHKELLDLSKSVFLKNIPTKITGYGI